MKANQVIVILTSCLIALVGGFSVANADTRPPRHHDHPGHSQQAGKESSNSSNPATLTPPAANQVMYAVFVYCPSMFHDKQWHQFGGKLSTVAAAAKVANRLKAKYADLPDFAVMLKKVR